MWLFLAFLAVPMIEIALFIQVGGLIGLWPTLAIVVLTAVIGTWLLRMQGAVALSNLRRSFSDLDDPSEPLAHGAMILFSGAGRSVSACMSSDSRWAAARPLRATTWSKPSMRT
jgi:UPF0716 protein FxsA